MAVDDEYRRKRIAEHESAKRQREQSEERAELAKVIEFSVQCSCEKFLEISRHVFYAM